MHAAYSDELPSAGDRATFHTEMPNESIIFIGIILHHMESSACHLSIYICPTIHTPAAFDIIKYIMNVCMFYTG